MNTANFLSIPASMFSDQEIIVFEGTRFTYGEALARVRRLASSLCALGVKPGDRVAVLQTNCHQFIETYYATATLGATFVPLNYRAKLPELEYMVATANVKILFTGDRYIDMVKQLQPKFSNVQYYAAIESTRPDMLSYGELVNKDSTKSNHMTLAQSRTF